MSNVSMIDGHIDENKITPEKAIKFFNEEIRRLEIAPKINGCKMTDEWKEQLEFCKTAKSAIEKQMPKKGAYEYVSSYTDDNPVMICPCCQNSHPCEASNLYKYCFYCGQALDWGDTE